MSFYVYTYMCVCVCFHFKSNQLLKMIWGKCNKHEVLVYTSPPKKTTEVIQITKLDCILIRFGNLGDCSEFPLATMVNTGITITTCQDTWKSFPSKHRLKPPLQEESGRKGSQNISYKINLARCKHLKYRNLHKMREWFWNPFMVNGEKKEVLKHDTFLQIAAQKMLDDSPYWP